MAVRTVANPCVAVVNFSDGVVHTSVLVSHDTPLRGRYVVKVHRAFNDYPI
jgi:hypothetical protein